MHSNTAYIVIHLIYVYCYVLIEIFIRSSMLEYMSIGLDIAQYNKYMNMWGDVFSSTYENARKKVHCSIL